LKKKSQPNVSGEMAGFRKKAYKVEQKIFGKGGIKGRYGIG